MVSQHDLIYNYVGDLAQYTWVTKAGGQIFHNNNANKNIVTYYEMLIWGYWLNIKIYKVNRVLQWKPFIYMGLFCEIA